MKEATNSYKSLNTILMYFGLGKEEYWHIDYPEYNFDYNGKNYFWDISKKAIWFEGEFDEDGIYLYKGADGKNYYSVINLAQYALGSYEQYLKDGSKKWYDEFIKHCDWLVNNQEKFKECEGIWVNKYPMKVFNLKGEWSSALSQAFGISALTRAYKETNNSKYLNAALLAAEAYITDLKDGGVYYNEQSFFCLEEYTTPLKNAVLNGYITAILSLYDLSEVSSNKGIEELYKKHLKNVEESLDLWDNKYWSYYSLYSVSGERNLASYFYHKYHVKMMRVLYQISGKKVFDVYAIKWEKRTKNKLFCIAALIHKVIYRFKRN